MGVEAMLIYAKLQHDTGDTARSRLVADSVQSVDVSLSLTATRLPPIVAYPRCRLMTCQRAAVNVVCAYRRRWLKLLTTLSSNARQIVKTDWTPRHRRQLHSLA